VVGGITRRKPGYGPAQGRILEMSLSQYPHVFASFIVIPGLTGNLFFLIFVSANTLNYGR